MEAGSMKILPAADLGRAAEDPVPMHDQVTSRKVPEMGEVGGTGIMILMIWAGEVLVDRDAVDGGGDVWAEGREAGAVDLAAYVVVFGTTRG